ncbi:MAG: HAMP domain-containing sensor histidine kinase [Eubacteriales bacterium]|nr:HAMP domain-containing sensor histidine kinase [Eubacteriales bacterium]
MAKKDINNLGRSMRKFVFRIVIIGISLVIVSNLSNLFMTWLLRSFLNIQNIYLESELELLGTLIIVLIILLIVFIIYYRARKRELNKLTEAIERVASGDYTTKIEYSRRETMSHVYSDFNKMIAELQGVAFLRRDFINNFSHEFKTPVASINGFSSLMLERNLSEKERQTYLEIIREESERLSKLANNTILLTKLTSLDYIYDVEKYDLGEQLRQCAIILSSEWTAKQQTVTGDFAENVMFPGNRELMQQLWINLIGNAVKYTPSHGEISISLKVENMGLGETGEKMAGAARAAGAELGPGAVRAVDAAVAAVSEMDTGRSMAVVTISDNGIGMDEETKKHLFEPYYQADGSHSMSGMGLGLAIVHHIVLLCEGSIDVESNPGEGSTFTVRLPL